MRSKEVDVPFTGQEFSPASYWRKACGEKVEVLVDGDAYFSRLAASLEEAESVVFLIGWDFHPHILLRRDGEKDATLAGILKGSLIRNKALRV